LRLQFRPAIRIIERRQNALSRVNIAIFLPGSKAVFSQRRVTTGPPITARFSTDAGGYQKINGHFMNHDRDEIIKLTHLVSCAG